MNRLDWNELKNPQSAYRPMTRWWWPGLDVDEKILVSQLDDMKEGGFSGAEIQAFLRGASHLDPNNREQMLKTHRYGTEAYFDIVRKLMQKAKEKGLLMELTAGSGYPLGDTEIEPQQDGMKAMIVGSVYVKGGDKCTVKLPAPASAFNQLLGPERSSSYMTGKMVVWSMDWPRMRRDLKLEHVVIARGDRPDGEMNQSPKEPVYLDLESMKDVTGFVTDGELKYAFPEGDWYVFASFEGPSYQRVKTDSRMNPDKDSYVVDHFSSGRIKPYLDRHIGKGYLDEFSANPFRAFFLDSFELVGPYFWAEAFATEFRNRRGYEITPYLPVLMAKEYATDENGRAVASFDLKGDAGERIRRDYDLTLAEMFSDYFLTQASEWGRAHGIQSRVQCYGHVMDPIKAFGTVDIPETEQLASAGLLDFLKMPVSAAMLYNKPLTTAEAFVWSGCDYMESPNRMLMASDKLTSAGVGQLIYHGMPYIHPEYAWPGYFAWHNSFGSFINRNSLLWPYIGAINTAISRNQYLTQRGKNIVTVAVYMGGLKSELPYTGPEFREELSDGEIPVIDRRERYDHIRFDTRCDRWQYVAAKTRQVGLQLAQNGYGYLYINGEKLKEAVLKDGKLCIGQAEVEALCLPEVDFMAVETAECIEKIIKSGFPVYCIGKKPENAFGFLNAEENDRKVQDAFEKAEVVGLESLSACLKKSGVLPLAEVNGAKNLDVVLREFADGVQAYFIRSHIFEKRMVSLSFASDAGTAVLYDTRSGKTAKVSGTIENGWTKISIPFTHFGAVWVLFGAECNGSDDQWYHELLASVSGQCGQLIQEDWRLTLTSSIPSDKKSVVRENYTAADWSDDEELSRYTGWGAYEKTVLLKDTANKKLYLDLGVVCDIAKVFVNGQAAGERIAPPYAFSISDFVREGNNEIRIEVLNSMRNGMIAAELVQTPHTLAASGLIGPVRIVEA